MDDDYDGQGICGNYYHCSCGWLLPGTGIRRKKQANIDVTFDVDAVLSLCRGGGAIQNRQSRRG